LPAVTSVSASTALPLADGSAGWTAAIFVEGRPQPRGGQPPIAAVRAVASDYFAAMGMRLFSGRGLDWQDIERNERIAVVDDLFAHVLFPGESPIGRRVRLPGLSTPYFWLTIVGVVANTPTRALAEPRRVPKLYIPLFTDRRIGPPLDALSYVVRSTTPPLSLVRTVRAAIREVDANLALAQVRTLQDILDLSSAHMAFTMVLLVIAATVALTLGVIGIYGAMSYIVSQRTNEIGIRLALGAQPSSVIGLIVRQGAIVALAGIAVGLSLAAAEGRLIQSLLYEVSPRDPGVLISTALMLLTVALLGCWLPARRAARLNALDALRAD
jgi:putative ABC transport system permease protein